MSGKIRALMVAGTLALAAAPGTAGASIVTYPLPEYSGGGTNVNEDITNLLATPGGNIWWDAFAPGNIGEIEPSHASAGTAAGERVVKIPGGDGNYPEGLALGPDGNLYFGLANPGALWKLEPASSTPVEVNGKTISNANNPIEMTFSPKNGNLFFSSRANTVVEAANPAYESLTSTGVVSEPYPWGIKVDASGNAWVGEDGRGGAGHGLIGEVPYGTGNQLLQFAMPNATSEPQRLTIDHSGNVWFIDRVNNSVGELIPSATKAGTSAGVSEYPIPGQSGEELPYDIATAADGSIWFTESAKSLSSNSSLNQIGKVTPVGAQAVLFSMQPTPDGKQPQAIVGDGAGNVWYSAGGGNSSNELGEVVGGGGGSNEVPTGGGGTTTSSSSQNQTTSAAVVETVTTSSGQSITLSTGPGQAGYAELDKHLLGGLSGNDISKLLANGGFSVQIPLTYPAYAGDYSASGSASPSGIPGYNGEGVGGGEFTGSTARSRHLAPVVLFRYTHNFTRAGVYTAKIRLTTAGKRLLRAAQRAHRKLRVSVVLSLTAPGHLPIHQVLTTTLKPGPRRGKH